MNITDRVWVRGMIAAMISGLSGGILTGLASIGIAPDHFNLQDPKLLFKVMLASAAVNAVIGVASYLQKSPLPQTQ
jgi:Na+/proline symporter